ncbi:MAG: L-threonylcarbamoyladenylate synthase [Opitutales bacterium]
MARDFPPSDFPEAPVFTGASSFLLPPTPGNLAAAAQRLRNGGLVGVPTETVYGLAANALDAVACEQIFALKGRPLLDPLIVHLRDAAQASELCETNQAAEVLMRTFWPGALTLVLPKKPCVPDIVTAGKPSVAVRCPAHPVFQQLIAATDRPLAAPSANPFGYISPTRAEHVRASFRHCALPILDGGPCAIGIESTILDLRAPESPVVLRAGHIRTAQLAATLGLDVKERDKEEADANGADGAGLDAPGLLSRHYSPHTPARLVAPRALIDESTPTTARVFFRRPTTDTLRSQGDFWLTETGEVASAERALYALLRQLDADPRWQSIMVERPPPGPLFAALRDRLTRATSCA